MEDIGTFLDFITEKQTVLLTEGRSEKGLEAELMLFKLLGKYHRLPAAQAKPAGFSAHDVDMSFIDKSGKDPEGAHNLEVKFGLPDFGQFELKWDAAKKWRFKNYGTNNPDPVKAEKAKIIAQLRRAKVETKINENWYKAPNFYLKKQTTFKDRAQDERNFQDQYFGVNPNFIARYYNSKGVNYINVCSQVTPGKGRFGLYHFGSDPAKTGCPLFKPQTCEIRIRLKPRDSRSNLKPRGYGFLGALKIGDLPKSEIDLANPADIVRVLGGYI